LLAFLALYRASADDETLVQAVLFVAKALISLKDAAAREAVQHAATDPLTTATLRTGLADLLARPAPDADRLAPPVNP
jgi:hypothetical protein